MGKIVSFDAWEKGISESSVEETALESMNEGILDSIKNFFKGIFDLFSDKKVKKEVESSSGYLNGISDDEDISDEDLGDEIDIKRVRRSSDSITKASKERIKVNREAGVKSSKVLSAELASWYAMLIAQEEALKMPLIEKMLKTPEMARRFVWVPAKWSDPKTKLSIKTWYSSKECVLDKAVSQELIKVIKTPAKDRKAAVTKLADMMISNTIATHGDKVKNLENFKKNDPAYLKILLDGYAASMQGIMNGVTSVITNSPDDKLTDVIASEIITERTRKKKNVKKDTTVKKDAEDEGAGSDIRGRKKSKMKEQTI